MALVALHEIDRIVTKGYMLQKAIGIRLLSCGRSLHVASIKASCPIPSSSHTRYTSNSTTIALALTFFRHKQGRAQKTQRSSNCRRRSQALLLPPYLTLSKSIASHNYRNSNVHDSRQKPLRSNVIYRTDCGNHIGSSGLHARPIGHDILELCCPCHE